MDGLDAGHSCPTQSPTGDADCESFAGCRLFAAVDERAGSPLFDVLPATTVGILPLSDRTRIRLVLECEGVWSARLLLSALPLPDARSNRVGDLWSAGGELFEFCSVVVLQSGHVARNAYFLGIHVVGRSDIFLGTFVLGKIRRRVPFHCGN